MENKMLQNWVQEMAKLCKPKQIVWIDGSREQKEALEREAEAAGEIIRLDQKKWPGGLYHRTAVNDVARTENLTYICTRRKEDAGPTNNWMEPQDAYRRAAEYFNEAMRGRTIYGPVFNGPDQLTFSKIGVELTDSIYVVLNMLIVTRRREVLAELGPGGDFTRCLHSKADLDIKKRLILHFPEDNTIWSVGFRLRRQCAAGQKVPRPAYRQLPRIA